MTGKRGQISVMAPPVAGAPHRLRATPVRGSLRVRASQLAMVFWIRMDTLRRTETGDGQLCRWRTGVKDTNAKMHVREHVKNRYLASKLTSALRDSVRAVHMTIVPVEGVEASELYAQFQANPEVPDYTRVHSFRFVVELNEPPESEAAPAAPHEAVAEALDKIMHANRVAVGEERADPKTDRSNGFKRSVAGDVRLSKKQLHAAVSRTNDEVHDYNSAGAHYRFDSESADWSETFLRPSHLRKMIETMTGDKTTFRGATYGLHEDAFEAAQALHAYRTAYWTDYAPKGANPRRERRLRPP